MYQNISYADYSNRKYTGKKWCKTHVTGIWGEGYVWCSKGFRTKDCVEGEKDKVEENPKSWGYLTEPI